MSGAAPAAGGPPAETPAPEGTPRAPELPPTLSYTSLSLLERCGYRYYLERVLRMPEDHSAPGAAATRGMEPRARGTLVHRLMETHDFASSLAPGEGQVADAASELGLRASSAEREEIAAMIAAALRSPLAARIAAGRHRRAEHPFAFGIAPGAPLVTGVVDLLCSEPDGTTLLVDYKSDRLAPEARTEELAARDYGVQRLLYALAVLREGALVVEVVHWFLERPDEPAVARYTLAERATLEERLAQTLAAAWADPFAVTRRPHRSLCLSCPGRAAMCSWGEEMTMREDPAEPSNTAG